MNDDNVSVANLRMRVKDFVHSRDWERYHNPKNLAESICIEAGELLEVFQWVSAEESLRQIGDPSELGRVKEELADVLIYCFSLANVCDIDVADSIENKLRKNSSKYPIEKFRGRARL
jgi:dCTP diphosphatase